MIINTTLTTDIDIKTLEDLPKLKILMEVNHLKINKSQVARELGVDYRTVTKYLNGYKKPTTRNTSSKIDTFYPIIKELLQDNASQIFYYKRVLWQYLKDNYGLDCAESSFRRYITRHPEFDSYFQKRRGKSLPGQLVMRFETALGQQAQLDWKENMRFTLKNGEEIIVNIFVLILSASRFRVYRLSLSKTQDVLFSFLNDAFETFGGVPYEILTDNMKTVMDEPRTEYTHGKVNIRFHQFANDYNFKVKPCIAGRPRTKAKVEAPMKLLDEIYAYNGTLDYQELHALVQRLNDRINAACHTSTGKIPILHLQKEKDFLQPLPSERIRNLYRINTSFVKVNPQSMISYRSNLYSVPPEYIGKRLKLQMYDGQLHLYCNTELVTIHRVVASKLNYHPEHYQAISEKTLGHRYDQIANLAKHNLKMIGEIYNHEH